jgi:hypothetical protein
MTDIIQICNNALSDVGLRPITSLNDGSTIANTLRIKVPSAIRTVLELDIPWNFATFRSTLAASPSTLNTAWDWAYQYPLLTEPDCLRILELADDARYEVGAHPTEGRVCWSNAGPPLRIRFIGYIDDTSRWNELAVKALEKMLASEVAQLSSAPGRNKQTLMQELGAMIGAGESRDAREGKPRVLTPNRTLIDVRGTRTLRRP